MVVLKKRAAEINLLSHRGALTRSASFSTTLFSAPPYITHRTKIWSVLVCNGGKWAEQSLYLIPTWSMSLVQRGEFLKIEVNG